MNNENDRCSLIKCNILSMKKCILKINNTFSDNTFLQFLGTVQIKMRRRTYFCPDSFDETATVEKIILIILLQADSLI